MLCLVVHYPMATYNPDLDTPGVIISNMTGLKPSLFHRRIALPQDHGSWIFLLSPLLIGLFAGGSFRLASAFLIIATMSAFLIRQPVTIAVKVYSGRRSKQDLAAAGVWMLVYAVIILAAVAGLIWQGFAIVLYLSVPAIPVFAWHLYLVSRRSERRQAGVEILATGILSLAAPATLWVGKGYYDPIGWALWLLIWLQAAASIVYAYLRLEQRSLADIPKQSVLFLMGRRAMLYTSFNLGAVTVMSLTGLVPRFLALPYLPQWIETFWGIMHPAIKRKPPEIGMRQLIVSTLFTILFIMTWRLR
jgi:hypothetical protein